MTTSSTTSPRRQALAAHPASRTFHAQAVWSATFAALAGPLVLTSIAMAIEVPDTLLGFAGVLPSLAGALTLVAAIAANRMAPRTATITFVVASRSLAAALVVIPLLGRSWLAIASFFVLALASLTLHAQATSSVNSWMLEFVPVCTRGAYNATRQTVSLLITSALSLIAGWLLDSLGASFLAFGVILLIAAVSAVPEVIVLRRIPALPPAAQPVCPRPRLRVVLKDRPFMALCAQVALFYLALLVSDSYTYAHMLGNLRLPATTITLFGLLGTLPQIVLLPWWGRRSDRLGHPVVLRVAMGIFAIETLLWAMAGRGAAIAWVPAAFLAAAIANSAFAVAVFARRYELMPSAQRVTYESVFTAITAAAYLAGPALGAAIRQALGHLSLGIEFAPVRGAYLVSTLALGALYVIAGRLAKASPARLGQGPRDRRRRLRAGPGDDLPISAKTPP